MVAVDVSVVIGFRDWGADRIRRSAQSIKDSFGSAAGEIIISDYGSKDPGPAEEVAGQVGAKHVYTAGDAVWSRSRALNAGFAVADGKLFVSTDADMLFSPRSFDVITQAADEAEMSALFLQCRDLPEEMGDDYFRRKGEIDWAELERDSRLRPRWGMGGMMAISSAGFYKIRGFDERLHTYGGEDLDFAKRARRAGYRTVWIDDPAVRMYHMWHAPSRAIAEQTEAGRQAVEFNKNVVYHDTTFTRNAIEWRYSSIDRPPLVSVVISTRDRASLISETIRSVLAQTMRDFELIIIDDGSEDDTGEIVKGFGDSRIRYFYQEPAGISAARNYALDVSRGHYTAVMDDDDLMPPRRLEWQVQGVTEGYVGAIGSFVNFDDSTGELELIISRVPSIAQASESGSAPGHGTWMIETDVMRAIRYDDTIFSGVDNNFFLRLLRSGYRLKHIGKPVLLRRRHAAQITMKDASNQGIAARQAVRFFNFGLTKWHREKLIEEANRDRFPKIPSRDSLIEEVRPFLPDSLVRRDAMVTLSDGDVDLGQFAGRARTFTLYREDELRRSVLRVGDATYQDLVHMAALGSGLRATVRDGEQSPPDEAWLEAAVGDFTDGLPEGSRVEVYLSAVEGAVRYTSSSNPMGPGCWLCLAGQASDSTLRPWMIVGVDLEEYWA